MLETAREMDMLTVPYAFNAGEAEMMATTADLIIIHTGYKKPPLSLDQAVERIRDILRAAREANPEVMAFCHGGPIEDPESFKRAYEETDVVGFMGFTGIERLPAVNAIQERVKEFKRVQRKKQQE
jgi:predicted TIM-barrel enzyme